MANIQLLKYAHMPELQKMAMVELKTENNRRYTLYADEDEAAKAYDQIRGKIKDWVLAENLVVLTGAGSSIVAGDKGELLDEGEKRYTGKSVGDIWTVCKTKLDAAEVANLQQLLGEPEETMNLERFISKLETFILANGTSQDATMKTNIVQCENARDKIIETLKTECQLLLHPNAPHADFLRNILAARRRSQPRLKLFTLNYDTLFERAAETLNAAIVDGFSFTRTPTFNGSNFDLDIVRRQHHRVHHQENYEEKVFQLLKLHGSLDWEQSEGNVVRCMGFANNPLIVPPSAHKFEQSYEMPFFEMMSRFQQSLRQENTTLMVIGYSFNDAHVNRVISEALATNLNFEMVAISPTIGKDDASGVVGELLADIKRGRSNITLVSDSFQRFVTAMPKVVQEDDLEKNETPTEGAANDIPF